MTEHRCFIQPTPDKNEEDIPEENEDNEEQKDKKQPPSDPLIVYADFECLLNGDNQFIPDLIYYALSDDDDIHTIGT